MMNVKSGVRLFLRIQDSEGYGKVDELTEMMLEREEVKELME